MKEYKIEAINQAKSDLMKSVKHDKEELLEKVASLTSTMEIQKKKLGNLVGKRETGADINDVKQLIDSLRNQAMNLESQVSSRESELSRALEDCKVRK